MLNRFCVLLALATPLAWAGQSLRMGDSPANIQLPDSAPYNAIEDTRLEVRYHNVQPCTVASNFGNILTLQDILGIGCTKAGTTEWHVYNLSGPQSLGTIKPGSDIVLRLQRGKSLGKFVFEKWNVDGTGYVKLVNASGMHSGVRRAGRGGSSPLIGKNNGVASVAWVRWYSTTVPEGFSMPRNNAEPGDLGNWVLEGSLEDTSGRGMNLSQPEASWEETPTHSPVVQIIARNALAGAPMQLDGSDSFSYSDANISNYQWSQVKGPATAIFSSTSIVNPVVTGLVAGDYTFRLSVTDELGAQSSRNLTVGVTNIDTKGIQIYPLVAKALAGSTNFNFDLSAVQGSTEVRLFIRKPDGRTLSPILCKTAPCLVPVDNRQRDHSVKMEYLNDSRDVLATSEWIPFPVEQAEADFVSGVYNKAGAMNFANTSYFLGAQTEATTRYLSGRYDLSVSGNSTRRYNPNGKSFLYRDMSAIYPYELPTLIDLAEARGFKYEDMLIHMKANYSFSDTRYQWAGMDQFDAFERKSGNEYVNGVFLLNGSTYTDKTTAAYSVTAADVAIKDKLLLGYSEPFDEINFVLSTPASGTTVMWEYWNGSQWTGLSLSSDETQGLTQNGKILFSPPADWAQKVENKSRKKWWVRASVTPDGVSPVASRIFGDNWAVPGRAITWRGWDANSDTRINVGLGALEYNPTPPGEALARFRYQARTLGLWANNLFFANLSDVQNGQRTFARILVDWALPLMEAGKYNGLYMDDGIATPDGTAFSSPAGGWQKWSEVSGRDYFLDQVETYKAARDFLRETSPDAPMGINTTLWELGRHGDMMFIEFGEESHKGATFFVDVNPNKRSSRSGSYDQFKPENNPNGTKGLFAAWDTRGSDFYWNADYMVWDRGNRSPITALAAYYIVANENTRFSYNPGGWSYYNAAEFNYVKETPEFNLSEYRATEIKSGRKILVGDFTDFPAEYNSATKTTMVKIGATGEFLPVWKVNNQQLATNDSIQFEYPPNTGISLIHKGYLATDTLPPVERVVSYGYYFPALDIDIGVPDTNGYNEGRRNLKWKSPAEAGTKNPMQRRDFTEAIVVHCSGAESKGAQFAVYGNEIDLGGTYYPLRSDGTTGAGITTIRLRTGEGAILMKEPTP